MGGWGGGRRNVRPSRPLSPRRPRPTVSPQLQRIQADCNLGSRSSRPGRYPSKRASKRKASCRVRISRREEPNSLPPEQCVMPSAGPPPCSEATARGCRHNGSTNGNSDVPRETWASSLWMPREQLPRLRRLPISSQARTQIASPLALNSDERMRLSDGGKFSANPTCSFAKTERRYTYTVRRIRKRFVTASLGWATVETLRSVTLECPTESQPPTTVSGS